MQNYTQFTSAYEDESVETVPRVSMDIPTDIQSWKSIFTSTPVIVLYMWSNSCRPCHLVRDKFESLAARYQNENILFFKDNIDLPTSFHKKQVEVVPTFFILCDGHELKHPVYKSVYNGWDERMEESIRFHLSQSSLFQQRQQAHEQQQTLLQQHEARSSAPRLYCRNNVCYLYPDDDEKQQRS